MTQQPASLVLRVLFCCTLLIALARNEGAAQTATSVPLKAGMRLSAGVTIATGEYRLRDPGAGIVQISGSGFVIDFHGAVIAGPGGNQGIGIHITDARNVTIRNAKVRGCLWGIVIERSVGVKLLDCVTSYNGDLPPGIVIDESGTNPEDTHGGGILFRDCRNCLVQRNTSQHQWDGIDLTRSEGCTIEDGDYSYNGNWGVHLWNSSRNIFRRNRAVWCTTGAGTLYQALTGWQTYDAQAVGIDHNSNENRIENNDLRFGGDGIFIRANEGPIEPGTVVPPRNGSHRNILRGNDCSFSPNNAIEVDLVDDTVIEGNNCSFSHYGMWLGYSRRCIVRNNICINDTAHAIEIENGQNDRFENNVFGFTQDRPDVALVYLRQNGRDKTPSGPYAFQHNLFYGSRIGVLLHNTAVELTNNQMFWAGKSIAQIVSGNSGSHITERDNPMGRSLQSVRLTASGHPLVLRPGTLATLVTNPRSSSSSPSVLLLDDVPVWVREAADAKITFQVPTDFWDRPARRQATLTLFNGSEATSYDVKLDWPADSPRIDSVTPNPAKIGDTVVITGVHLNGGRILLDNRPVPLLQSAPTQITFRLPPDILTTTHYNLLWTRDEGGKRTQTWPITFGVEVPDAQRPRLTNATFFPTMLKVGDILTVTFTVRNDLPTPAHLMIMPRPPFTYEEKQSWEDVGVQEVPNTLHLRVTSDQPAGHDPGSWPWMFGFNKETLAPGETMLVTGRIRLQTPGVHEFRVGLVATGRRFLDDNAFRTKITVTP